MLSLQAGEEVPATERLSEVREGTGRPANAGQQTQTWSRKPQGVHPLISVVWDWEGPQGLSVKDTPNMMSLVPVR